MSWSTERKTAYCDECEKLARIWFMTTVRPSGPRVVDAQLSCGHNVRIIVGP